MPTVQLNAAVITPAAATSRKPETIWNGSRWQWGYVDPSTGQCTPFVELEDAGGANQLQRLSVDSSAGPITIDETGKIRVSGMVNQ